MAVGEKGIGTMPKKENDLGATTIISIDHDQKRITIEVDYTVPSACQAAYAKFIALWQACGINETTPITMRQVLNVIYLWYVGLLTPDEQRTAEPLLKDMLSQIEPVYRAYEHPANAGTPDPKALPTRLIEWMQTRLKDVQ